MLVSTATMYWFMSITVSSIDVWEPERTELEVKPNYGYQTDQYTPIQPAEDWQTISTLKEL